MDLDVDRSWPYFGADLNTAADLEIYFTEESRMYNKLKFDIDPTQMLKNSPILAPEKQYKKKRDV